MRLAGAHAGCMQGLSPQARQYEEVRVGEGTTHRTGGKQENGCPGGPGEYFKKGET